MFTRECPECGLDRFVSIQVFGEILRRCDSCKEADEQVKQWKEQNAKETVNV